MELKIGEEERILAKAKVTGSDKKEGNVTAVVSVWDNIDYAGDVMKKGAFTKSLQEWKDADAKVPFLWSHKIDDLNAYVGTVEEARETDEGLEVDIHFDLDDKDAKKAYGLLSSGRIKEFSFGYIIRDAEIVKKGGEVFQEVRDVELLEVSMTMKGANPATRIVSVKNAPEGDAVEEKAVDSEESTSEFTIADLDNAIETVKSASESVNEVLQKLSDLRASLSGDAEEETVQEDSEIDKQATTVKARETDEEPSEAKSDTSEPVVAKAEEDFELQNSLIELERMLQK